MKRSFKAARFVVALFVTALVAAAPAARADTVSPNSGSLGAAANGTNTTGVLLEQPSPISAGTDIANFYSGGARTTIPYLAALNPSAGSPFTIEFWARPTASDNDDSPLANRIAAGNRSGWAFFQRDAATGWNFRMYDGVGSNLGWDLTGGTATLNAWSHVVATWNGSAAQLYVNGTLADSTNTAGLTGTYNASTSAIFSIGALFDGGSPSTALIDEVAFYPSALTATQIMNHRTTAIINPVPGAYHNRVLADGAILSLRNNLASTPLAGDINLDGSVTRQDAALFAQYYGLAPGSDWSTGDFNGDFATTLADLALLQANLSPAASPFAASSMSAVPEPSTTALIALGGLSLLATAVRKRGSGTLQDRPV